MSLIVVLTVTPFVFLVAYAYQAQGLVPGPAWGRWWRWGCTSC